MYDKKYFNVFAMFQCDFGWNLKVKFARITITGFVSFH